VDQVNKAMNILGLGFEDHEIEEIQDRFPDFEAVVPPEARFWTQKDLEVFFSSNGVTRPQEIAGNPCADPNAAVRTCPLLSKLRRLLAELHVDEASSEYLSYCWHIKERKNPCKLPAVASCGPVRRVRACPENPQGPFTVTRGKDIRELAWSLNFWLERFWADSVVVRARTPAFETDRGIDAVSMETTVFDYVEYLKLVESADKHCNEEQALAYPRVQINGWSPFATGPGRSLFNEAWRDLTPPGVQDTTARWVELMFRDGDLAGICGSDWLGVLSKFYEVSICVTGAVSRLRVENYNAHAWFTQIEGQKIFFVFPPQDGSKLYEERGRFVDSPDGYTTCASPVDVFYPSIKRHPRFAEANAQVAYLRAGDTLVLPAGWWYTTIATEPSVTLKHRYWGMENRLRIVDELWASYDRDDILPEVREELRDRFRELRDLVNGDGT